MLEIVSLPEPNGRTVEEKYEYARFLMLCKEPTVQLLNFLEKEKDNFTYELSKSSRRSEYSYKLVWDNGQLPSEIKRTGSTCNVSPYDCFVVYKYTGFAWANAYERPILEYAIDTIIKLSGERVCAAAEMKKKEMNEQQRFFLKLWLDDHEKI